MRPPQQNEETDRHNDDVKALLNKQVTVTLEGGDKLIGLLSSYNPLHLNLCLRTNEAGVRKTFVLRNIRMIEMVEKIQ